MTEPYKKYLMTISEKLTEIFKDYKQQSPYLKACNNESCKYSPIKPLYRKSISRLSVCSFMASRIESAVIRFVSRTTFSSSCIVINGKRIASRIGVGSTFIFWLAHSLIALKICISGAQNESLEINSFTED